MKIKDSILLTLKNLLHPAGLIGLVIAIIIPAIIWFLGRPSGGHKEIIRQLDLNLPLPLFLFQMAVAIILFAFLRVRLLAMPSYDNFLHNPNRFQGLIVHESCPPPDKRA